MPVLLICLPKSTSGKLEQNHGVGSDLILGPALWTPAKQESRVPSLAAG
jgi:hypothetical protein